MRLAMGVDDMPSSIVLQFAGTFGVWILAEHLHLSAIVTVVVYGITIARDAPRLVPARNRLPSYAVWDLVVFVLNVLAFVLIGLQLRPILGALAPQNGSSISRSQPSCWVYALPLDSFGYSATRRSPD